MTGTDGGANQGEQNAVHGIRVHATSLLAELNVLEKRHHSERDRCISTWFDRHHFIMSELQGAESSQGDLSPLQAPAGSEHAQARWLPGSNHENEPPDSIVPVPSSDRAPDPGLGRSTELPGGVDCGSPRGLSVTSGPVTGSSVRFVSGQSTRSLHLNRLKTGISGTRPEVVEEDEKQKHKEAVFNDMQKPTHSSRKRKKKPKRLHTFRLMDSSTSEVNSTLRSFTKSRTYEVTSGLLIIFNAIYIGYQTQYTAEITRDWRAGFGPEVRDVLVFIVLQVLFCVFFSFELAVRWKADGFLEFFRSAEHSWNFFDVFVVIFSWLDIALLIVIEDQSAGKQNGLLSNITLLRVLRVVRIVRIAKVIRVMRFFRELRMMVFSILGSLKSLMWSMMVFGLNFFVFGISLTAGATEFMESTASQDWEEVRDTPVLQFFGTLDRSMLTLYMSITGGNDWSVYYEALLDLSYQYRMFFMVFQFFSVVAVLNVVTGVFVESAMLSGTTDREILVHEEMEAKKSYKESMREFFEEADEDGTGNISYSEFTKKLDDERVIAYFQAFKLDVSDASLLFTLLDYDNSGEIEIEEFLDGCYKLQGESRALDMKVMQLEVRFLKESFIHMAETLEALLPSWQKTHRPSDPTDRKSVV